MRIKLIGLLILVNCSGHHDKVNGDVTQLRKELPLIETPIEFNSDRMVKYKSYDLEGNELIEKLTAKSYFSLLGKIFETDEIITIVGYIPGDIGTPILITFDNKGNRISSHVIYENAMRDVGRYTLNVVTILPDRQILFTDSTLTNKINAEGSNGFPGIDSLSVTRKKYLLSDKGTIEVLE